MSWKRGRAAALALLASVMAAACGDASDLAANDTFAESTTTTAAQAASGTPTRGGPPPTPHPHTPPIDFDPIAPLPVTDATDRLVVSTIGDGQPPLLFIDLGRLDVVPLTDATATRVDAAFGGTGLAYTIDDRTLSIIVDIDDPGSTVRAALPDDVPGVITGLIGDTEGFVAAVGVPLDPADPYGRRAPGPYVLFGPDGDLRCVTSATAPSPWPISLSGGVLSFNVATVVDRRDCQTQTRFTDADLDSVVVGTIDERLVLADSTSVSVRDADTGARLHESQPLGDFVTAVIVADGAIWALVDGDLVKLDPDTLDVVHRAGPLPCVATPYLVQGGGSLWVVDDCSGLLAEVDSSTGDYVEAWMLPHDDESDQQVAGFVVGDGIWFVDIEQSGEPYRFDFEERRFERMPIRREVAETIYALEWDVSAGP